MNDTDIANILTGAGFSWIPEREYHFKPLSPDGQVGLLLFGATGDRHVSARYVVLPRHKYLYGTYDRRGGRWVSPRLEGNGLEILQAIADGDFGTEQHPPNIVTRFNNGTVGVDIQPDDCQPSAPWDEEEEYELAEDEIAAAVEEAVEPWYESPVESPHRQMAAFANTGEWVVRRY